MKRRAQPRTSRRPRYDGGVVVGFSKRVSIVVGAIAGLLGVVAMLYGAIVWAIAKPLHQEIRDVATTQTRATRLVSEARYEGDSTIIFQVGLMARAMSEPDPGARRVLLERVQEIKAPVKKAEEPIEIPGDAVLCR